MRCQRLRGAEGNFAGGLVVNFGVRRARAFRPRVNRALAQFHRLRKPDARLGEVDWEYPAVARRVPIELVKVLEPAELARRPVADDEAVLADFDDSVWVADLDPDHIGERL